MKTFDLVIKSKNQSSIAAFLRTVVKNNHGSIRKCFQKKTKHKRFSILKSPHVNKKAQEQFEQTIHTKQITIESAKSLQCLTFLKNLRLNFFPDLFFTVKYRLSLKDFKKIKLKTFNPINFKLKTYRSEKKFNISMGKVTEKKENINVLLHIYDFYGEFLKKNV